MTNEQIALAVGFKRSNTKGIWWYPAHALILDEKDLPDFLHSFDDCEKWIVPVLVKRGMIEIHHMSLNRANAECVLQFANNVGTFQGWGKSIPAAFCEAAYKYLSEVRK